MSAVAAPPVTRALAELAAGCRFEDLGTGPRDAATAAIADTVARAVAGARSSAVSTALAALEPLGLPPEAAVLGREERTSILWAPLLNGLAAGSADEGTAAGDRPVTAGDAADGLAGAVVPAALAVGEWRGSSGTDVVAAVAAGLEVAARVRAGLGSRPEQRGWDVAGAVGPLGAAAAAGRLLGLDAPALALAIGIASAQPTGFAGDAGTMTGALHPGRAAAAGTEAALLAERGFTAPPAAIEGRRGLAHVLAPEADLAAMLAGAGDTWLMADGARHDAGPAPQPVRAAAAALADGAGLDELLRLAAAGADEPDRRANAGG